MEFLLGLLIVLAVLGAIVLRAMGRHAQVETGVPLGVRVLSSDTSSWRKLDKPLFSSRYRLTGKPDYIVADERGAMIPIEVKPNRTAQEPRPWDTMQLMAYGMLLEEQFGQRAPYGLLKYRDAEFRVEFGDALRGQLIDLLSEMRAAKGAENVRRSHDDPRRCASCGYRGACEERIEDEGGNLKTS